MRRPETPPAMDFFATPRRPAGQERVVIGMGALPIALEGLDAPLRALLVRRYGKYVLADDSSGAALTVRLKCADTDYFIDPPEQPELNPVLVTPEADRVRMLGYRVAGWFEIAGGQGEIVLASGDYEPPDRAIENYIRVAVAWLAAARGGALVHAASAVRHGNGYLFYGHSGAGKSTLSECNRSAEVVSDDLSLVLPGERGGLELVGSPFRGTYEGGEPVLGSYSLRAGFRILQAPEARVEEVSRAVAWSGLLANLPFVNDSFQARPELLARVQQAFADLPLAHLHFRKDDSYWDAIDAAGY